MRIILAVTGATGAVYAARALRYLSGRTDVEVHLVMSRWAKETLRLETGEDAEALLRLADVVYEEQDVSAAIASGSYPVDAMAVLPCSMKTLSAIANGYSDGLIARAADVTMKEGRKLVLAVRETPLSAIHLENMLKLARLGVVIMPPVPGFYSGTSTVEGLVDTFVGRLLGQLGVENELIRPWNGPEERTCR